MATALLTTFHCYFVVVVVSFCSLPFLCLSAVVSVSCLCFFVVSLSSYLLR